MITVDVQDHGVQDALQALSKRVSNMQPILQAIGENLMERTKERFGSGTGPDGQRWKPNARATIEAFLRKKMRNDDKPRTHNGKRVAVKNGYLLKDGRIGGKSILAILGKRPLIDSGQLVAGFSVKSDARSVSVNTNWRSEEIKGGAAVHQFGSKNGRIPARPFFPIKSDGSLYPQEQRLILAALNAYLTGK